MSKVERAEQLDGSVTTVKKAVDATLSTPEVRDALHGVWLGHPLHPALVVVPLGSWVSASVLDFLPGGRRAAQALVGLGVLATVPTAAAGAADWSDLSPRQQRTGLVHAASNLAALALQVASWRARRRGQQARGTLLSLTAMGIGGLGAYLGGHMAYRQGAGVDHAEPALHLLPTDWRPLAILDELPDGRPVRRVLDAVPLFVLRRDGRVDVLVDECAHLAGPLSEGELSGAGGELCITCPWHGSRYAIADGSVRRGPTTHPQPVLEVRVEPDGTVMTRLQEDG